MRLFVAVDVPETLKTSIEELVRSLAEETRRDRAKIKWAGPSQFHFTLKFLGECEEAVVPKLAEALDLAAAQREPFPITPNGIGAFPGRGTPHIIWLGVSEGQEPMAALSADIEAALEDLGFAKEERPFHAHLTLGRVKSASNGDQLRSHLEEYPVPPLNTITVETVTLYQSILSPEGPTYQSLHTSYLSEVNK